MPEAFINLPEGRSRIGPITCSVDNYRRVGESFVISIFEQIYSVPTIRDVYLFLVNEDGTKIKRVHNTPCILWEDPNFIRNIDGKDYITIVGHCKNDTY